jgi:carbonic anhydrase
MLGLDCQSILQKAHDRGVSNDVIHTLESAGIDLRHWLRGFSSVEEGLLDSVKMIRNHPLLPKDVPVHGLLIDSETGKLESIVDGYANQPTA